jgi:hypothetical protein
MTVERRTFLIWRIIQFWIFLNIFILEFVQFLGYYPFYWSKPANNQTRTWIFESISFIIIGYILINFNQRWKKGPTKIEMISDWILFIIWNIQSFLNISPAIFGTGLNCDLGSNQKEVARCHLFLGNTVLSFIALFTTIVTLVLSKSRWDNRELSSHGRKLQAFYKVQKGLLDNGEPALFFYSKNTSPNSLHGTKLRNSIKNTSPSSINISIPEPEMAAIAKDSKDVHITFNDENENDNSVLKY